jgi:K+-transporting ATPase ATPase A chain
MEDIRDLGSLVQRGGNGFYLSSTTPSRRPSSEPSTSRASHTVLSFTAVAVCTEAGRSSIFNPGPHGFSEVLYAYTSMTNNNGSTFGGLNANTSFFNVSGALAMLIGRFWIAVPTLALAGSLARKRILHVCDGALPTHTPVFALWLTLVVLGVGAMCFLPALALGPIAEHLMSAN